MEPYTVLLIGYGNMGKEWAKVLTRSQSARLSGVLDVLEANRMQAMTDLKLGADQVGHNLKELIDLVAPEIIIDCSPPFAHSTNTLMALENGCHVLGEKPISLDFKEANHIAAMAKKAGKVYMVNQNYRWHPMVQAIRKYLTPLPLGKITAINISYAQNPIFNDTFRYEMEHPLLADMAIHHFDLVRSIMGANYSQVYCREFNPPQSRFKHACSATAIFSMDNGTVFSYQGSWSDIVQSKSFVGEWKIACENGTLFWDGVHSPSIEVLELGAVVCKELYLIDESEYAPESIFSGELESSLNAFIQAISSGVPPETWCGDNLHTLNMVVGSIASSARHEVIAANTF